MGIISEEYRHHFSKIAQSSS